ncbi:DUF3717 domain-containing protein [Achromobacter seleniivolatilans]|uniref:DUF3717 domain-containing protein n=1 Tax=Achromobacter seleniivolatilans TaxID=3047478 RepID=A0ABY9LWF4_9BURK|nr:DUF3717 domain-containing protein [Achromobacter sp. R39]WMD19010.1 DUF3717 domain-containing protein [Achromobacter sp. R39]
MNSISLPQLEQAINYWRNVSPSVGDESRLCPEAAALATPYALMIMAHRHDIPVAELNEKAQAALAGWLAAAGAQPSAQPKAQP